MNVIVTHSSHVDGLHLRLPSTRTLLCALAAFLALDAGLFAYAESPGGALNLSLDHVSSVTWTSGTTTLSSGPGFKAYLGSEVTVRLTDTNCLLGCPAVNFTTVEVLPASFAIVNTTLPVIAPGATGTFLVVVRTPSSSYAGPLTLDLI